MKAIAIRTDKHGWKLVAKLCNKSIKMVDTFSHSFMQVDDDKAESIAYQVQCMFPLTDVSIVDAQFYIDRANRANPICKVIENSDTAQKFDIKPWHHLHFNGSYIFKIVWDTRKVEGIIKIEELENKDFTNLYMTDSDNHKAWRVTRGTELASICKANVSLGSSITDEQFLLITGAKLPA